MLDFLQKYADWVKHADFLSWLFHTIKWGFTKFLYIISTGSEDLTDNVFSIFGFMDYEPVKKAFSAMQKVSLSILVLAIMWIGLRMITNQKVKIKDTGIRLIILSSLIFQLPTVMNFGFDVAKTFFNDSKQIISSGSNESLSYKIIQTNTADMNYIAHQGFKTLDKKDSIKNKMTEKQFKLIQMNKVLTVSEIEELKKESKNEDVENMKYYITMKENGDGLEEKEIENGWFDIFDEGVFRFTATFGQMNVALFALALFNALLFSKLVLIAIDLVFAKIAYPLVAYLDGETGQKPKQLLLGIVSSLATIGFLGISRSLYVSYFAFIGTLSFNFIGYGILAIVGAFGFLRGSDTIARQFGINTSLKDGLVGAAAVYGAYKMAKAAPEVAKGVGGSLKAAKDTLKQAPKMAKESFDKFQDKIANPMASAAGNVAGHLSERGLKGTAHDMIDTSMNKVNEAGKNFSAAALQPAKDVKESFDEGVDAGISSGINHRSGHERRKTDQSDPKQYTGNPRTTTNSSDVPESNVSSKVGEGQQRVKDVDVSSKNFVQNDKSQPASYQADSIDSTSETKQNSSVSGSSSSTKADGLKANQSSQAAFNETTVDQKNKLDVRDSTLSTNANGKTMSQAGPSKSSESTVDRTNKVNMKDSTQVNETGGNVNNIHSKPPISTKTDQVTTSDTTTTHKTNVNQQHTTTKNVGAKTTTSTPTPKNSNLSVKEDRNVAVEVSSEHYSFSNKSFTNKKKNSYNDLYKDLKNRKK